MAITFYYGSGSAFSWRVFLALEHKQLEFEPKLLSFSAGEHKKPEFLAINPRHQVPALTDGDFQLYESVAIVEYLEDRYPDKPALFPREPQKRALTRRLIQEIDCYLAEHSERLVEELWFKRDPSTRNTGIITGACKGWFEEFSHFERELRGDFLTGELSAADYTLYPFLAQIPRFERVQADLGLSSALPAKLKAWMKRIEALPYFDKTYPPHWRG